MNACDLISQFRFVDFNWNDPTDKGYNNKNMRSDQKWTGVLAQEVVKICPNMVNAPRKKSDLTLDFDDPVSWSIDSTAANGILLKAVSELQARLKFLERETGLVQG